ncbi:MAG TPA: fumarylacetoacetate hydrolase family protein [Bacteroidales bacterium]|mgnify:CR=1 FL=1|nr:fumarylacetoacetate hydrolase family protein [Bacteroidales bacterium]
MKIICVARNYHLHIKELNHETPKEPTFFFKPDVSLLRNNEPFFIPEFSKNIHHEIELVYRICKVGKTISPRFAHRYYDAIALGVDFTARDLQEKCIKEGLPWEMAKAFDNAAAISTFIPKTEFENLNKIHFSLKINGNIVQQGVSSDMIFNIDEIIAHVSNFVTLKTGDLIYTGTPAGVGPVNIGDILEGFIEDKKMLHFKIR